VELDRLRAQTQDMTLENNRLKDQLQIREKELYEAKRQLQDQQSTIDK